MHIGEYSLYPNGSIKECMFTDVVELNTEYGPLVPQYEYEEHRRKYVHSLTFYESGSIRKIALNNKTKITTPIGNKTAELITFYESGKIKRLFPLNGRISAYWDESEEYQLATTETIELPCGTVNTKVIAYNFYENGAIKGLTFWPKELLKLMTPIGELKVRIGVSFYPEGDVKSIEPAYPVAVQTPIGILKAYDSNANGITGDCNSLMFSVDGVVKSLITSGMKVIVLCNDEKIVMEYSPVQDMDEDGIEISFQALKIEFDENENSVRFNDGDIYSLSKYQFRIEPYFKTAPSECSNCASCGLCLP